MGQSLRSQGSFTHDALIRVMGDVARAGGEAGGRGVVDRLGDGTSLRTVRVLGRIVQYITAMKEKCLPHRKNRGAM
jgi:hypothetical protein